MRNYIYETHTMRDPLLPFIYHHSFKVSQRNGLPNWHENIELLYCTGGKGWIQCGPESVPFALGDIFVVNADTPHSICSESSVLYRCLIIDNSFCTGNGIPIADLHFQASIRDEALTDLFCQVSDAYDTFDSNRICAIADIRCAVLQLLRYLCTHYTAEKPAQTGSAANAHIKDAMIHIRKHLSGPISLDDLAKHVGISKFHLSREFKAFTGKTVIQTVNLIRCTEAKSMIENGAAVCDAAVSCGFENLSYFTRTFKKTLGTLPSAFLPSPGRGRAARTVYEPETFCN